MCPPVRQTLRPEMLPGLAQCSSAQTALLLGAPPVTGQALPPHPVSPVQLQAHEVGSNPLSTSCNASRVQFVLCHDKPHCSAALWLWDIGCSVPR